MLQDLVQLNMNRIQQQAGPEAAEGAAETDASLHATPASESNSGQAQAGSPVVDSRVVPIQVGDFVIYQWGELLAYLCNYHKLPF